MSNGWICIFRITPECQRLEAHLISNRLLCSIGRNVPAALVTVFLTSARLVGRTMIQSVYRAGKNALKERVSVQKV